jgi:hypothetical protein
MKEYILFLLPLAVLSLLRNKRKNKDALSNNDDSNATTLTSTSTLKNSVKPYQRHCIVFGAGNADNWEAKIENSKDITTSGNLAAELIRKVKETVLKMNNNMNITITCSSEPSTLVGYSDIVVYPEELVFKVSPKNLSRFIEIITNNKRMDTNGHIDSLDKQIFKIIKTPWKHLITVCSHTKRDKRCGKIGPQVIDAIQEALALKIRESKNHSDNDNDNSGIDCITKVIDTSHIGGHKYAGTLIIYPQSDWYGLVTAKGDSIYNILNDINASSEADCYQKCHRGRANLVDW